VKLRPKSRRTVGQALSPSPQAESSQEEQERQEDTQAVVTGIPAALIALQTPAASHMDSDLEDDVNSVASSNFPADEDDDNSDISLDDGEFMNVVVW
jgi:hypothetical protein